MTDAAGGIPPGYGRVRAAGAEAIVWDGASAVVAAALDQEGALSGWAARQPGARSLRGRGIVHVLPAPVAGPDAREAWAVRHYRRGGVAGPWLGDRYLSLGARRPEIELRASAAARSRGIATPAVVAAAWYPSGLFYRADLVTEMVPDATTLAHDLFESARPSQSARSAALRAAGRLVARLAECGIRHPDLNAMNLLTDRHPSTPTLWVLDLDRAGIAEGPDERAGRPMLSRLERSLAKLGRAYGSPLPEREWSALREGFADEGVPEEESATDAPPGESRG